MNDGAAQNGGTQAASTGEAAAVAATMATGAANAAPAAAQAAAAVPAPIAPAAPQAAATPAAPLAAAIAATAVAQPAPAAADDCAPPKKKVAHKHNKKETEEEHARLADSDEDQNLSQPADGCVLPQTGQTAAPVPQDAGATPVYDDGEGGGISSGLLIGAGVLAAIGVGVLALAKDDEEKNAPPVANADTAAVNEGSTLSGSVATNDSDPNNDPLTFALSGTAPAGLTFNANGTYTFDANNAEYNSLAAGATRVLSIPYTVSDGRGGTANSTLTITVTGTNDAPTVTADTAAVNEDATVTGNLRTNDSDADTGAALTYTVVGTAPAGLTVNTDGTFTFNAANAAYQDLAAGQTRVVTANIAVSDGTAPAVNTTLTITVTGTNDAPVAVADVNAGVEGAGTLTGSVRTNDSDPDQGATLTYSLNAPVAGLVLNADGTYTFDLNNAAYDDLDAGETRVVVANIAVSDGIAPPVNSTLTITVTGTADGPLAVADTLAATEGAAVVTGSVATNDDNSGASGAVTYSLDAPVAGLTVNPDGTFSFNPADPSFDALAAGETRVVVANITATDAAGTASTSTLTITVTGTNDDPVAVNDTNAGVEDGPLISGSVATNDSDVDTPAANLVYSVVGTTPAGFNLSPNGSYTLDPANAAYQNLRQGEVLNVVVNYQVADGQGGTDTATLTIAVTGVAETVNLDVDTDNNLNTARVFDGAATDFNFTDDDDVANTVIINNFGADDFITFDAPFNGAGRVSFASGDFDNDGVADDINITTNKGGVVSDIILTNVVDPNAVVFDEATAEAAVAGDNNFRTTTQGGTPVQQSLDIDDQANNPDTPFTLPVAANTATFAFSDSVSVANNVVVRDFGGDDVITFSGALSQYQFASGDYDSDGVADDLRIISNVNGVVSDIVLTNSVAADAVVTNEAQAEAAIGAGTDNFVFNGTVTPPPPPPPAGNTTQSLDADDDNNSLSTRVFDALADGFRFTDDAEVANTAQINNFGANDRVVLEAGNTYSFTSGALDSDGIGNDLTISLNKGGVVSLIVIKDVVDPNAFVQDAATAEAAVNTALGTTGIDYFSFA